MQEMECGQPRILVTDFDGTLTRHDFYQLVRDRLLPAETPNFWADYLAGRATHFECLQKYFAGIRADDHELLALIHDMELEPGLKGLVSSLTSCGWEVVIASAGCEWYIRRLLDPLALDVTIHANPGEWRGGDDGLVMSLPTTSRFCSHELGIDKAAIVKDAINRSEYVAFAGDGLPDVEAALVLPADRRFARGACAEELSRLGEGFRPFTRWADVAEELLREN